MQRFVSVFLRVGGALLAGAALVLVVDQVALNMGRSADPTFVTAARWAAAVIGGFLGAAAVPAIVTDMHQRITAADPITAAGAGMGALVGLAGAGLGALVLRTLPGWLGALAPTVVGVAVVFLSVAAFTTHRRALHDFLTGWRIAPSPPMAREAGESSGDRSILLDTSVVIDGRIADVTQTGFIFCRLLVPAFVLQELQHVADNPDPIRRKRGRRGLDVLSMLQAESPVEVEIIDTDVSESRDVDHKLVSLAKHLDTPIMTNDYNLNRVASLQGVPVLNINDLANAVKAAYLPGEELNVKLIQEGREPGQGVGYLDDGTMVVVEDGAAYLNEMHSVLVTKVLQTTAGRMIFARFPG